jgi:ribosomal protein S18 acetylase RimI-like enzyme
MRVSHPIYTKIIQVMDDNLTPCGYLFVFIHNEDSNKVGGLLGLIRHPDYKGQGVVEQLYKDAIKVCRKNECDIIRTTVLKKRTGVIKLLRKLGFKEVNVESKNHRRFEIRK